MTILLLVKQGVDHIFYGGDGNDYIRGRDGENYLYGEDGDDILADGTSVSHLDGGSGNDTVDYSIWNSNAVTIDLSTQTAIDGLGSTDVLTSIENAIGSKGDDIIIGDSNVNILSGGAGADDFIIKTLGLEDIITDFNTADDDALDISNLLTAYDPLTDALTDFVEITDDGTNSFVAVDMDGTGSTYAMTQIATLENVIGLTDESALVAAGNLIV